MSLTLLVSDSVGPLLPCSPGPPRQGTVKPGLYRCCVERICGKNGQVRSVNTVAERPPGEE
jgi:hypothetical protein